MLIPDGISIQIKNVLYRAQKTERPARGPAGYCTVQRAWSLGPRRRSKP